MPKPSPTQRTLARLRKSGHIAQVVERFNPHAGPIGKGGKRCGIRQDMFGFVDIVAIHPAAKRILFVQSTVHGEVSKRVRKIITDCAGEALACVDAGAVVEVWGWQKVGARWVPTVREVTREEIAARAAERSRKSKRRSGGSQKELSFVEGW